MNKNTHISNCKKTAKVNKTSVENKKLKTLANKYEKNSGNTNIFNGKNISDHTKATFFQ